MDHSLSQWVTDKVTYWAVMDKKKLQGEVKWSYNCSTPTYSFPKNECSLTPIKIDQWYNSEHIFSKTLLFRIFFCKCRFIQNILIIIYCIVSYCITYCIVILNIVFKGCKKLSPLLERNRLCSSLSRFLRVPGTWIVNHEYNVQWYTLGCTKLAKSLTCGPSFKPLKNFQY